MSRKLEFKWDFLKLSLAASENVDTSANLIFKTSWNNIKPALVIQRRGRVETDYKIGQKFA